MRRGGRRHRLRASGRRDGGNDECGSAGLEYCTELTAIVNAQDETTGKLDDYWPGILDASAADRLGKLTASSYHGPLTESIPSEVLCGNHLCLGTWPKFPAI